MAIIKPTFNKTNMYTMVSWKNMTSADTAAPHQVISKQRDMSVQFEGTFGAGTVATMTGSMANTTYSPCLNSARGAVSTNAPTLVELLAPTPYYKPTVSGGTGDSVTVSLIYWMP